MHAYTKRWPCCTLFFEAGNGWKMDGGGQQVILETGKEDINRTIRSESMRFRRAMVEDNT